MLRSTAFMVDPGEEPLEKELVKWRGVGEMAGKWQIKI